MQIIDTHGHLGPSPTGVGTETSESDVLRAMEAHDISVTLVMPQSLQQDERAAHDRVHAFALANPGQIYGMASISPLWDDESYFAEARRCVNELGFKALKLHPGSYNTSPLLPRAEKCFRAAAELGVPLIGHTGARVPPALPSLIIPGARQFPDLTIVLAHAGYAIYCEEALVAALTCPNGVLEPPWCQYYNAARMTLDTGSERMVMGSDHPANLAVELAKWRAAGLSESDLANCMGLTARRVFKLP